MWQADRGVQVPGSRDPISEIVCSYGVPPKLYRVLYIVALQVHDVVEAFFNLHSYTSNTLALNALSESSISSKKRTKTCRILVKMNSFVLFLEEFTA